jgi:hypothetical protein
MTTSENYKGFDLITIASGENRKYRISRELLQFPDSLSHYDFDVNFNGMIQGQLFHIRIPYLSSNYLHPSLQTNPLSISDQDTAGGEKLDGHLFKLIYRDEGIFNRGVPNLVDPDRIYSINGINVQFVFFKIFGGTSKFTNPQGDLLLNTDVIPEVIVDPSRKVLTVVDSIKNITFHIIRLDSTPNIIYTIGDPVIPTTTEDYTIGPYRFRIGSNGNGYVGIPFKVYVVMSMVDGSVYNGNRPHIVENEEISSVSYISEYQLGLSRVYLFGVVSVESVNGVDISASL